MRSAVHWGGEKKKKKKRCDGRRSGLALDLHLTGGWSEQGRLTTPVRIWDKRDQEKKDKMKRRQGKQVNWTY